MVYSDVIKACYIIISHQSFDILMRMVMNTKYKPQPRAPEPKEMIKPKDVVRSYHGIVCFKASFCDEF